MTNEKEILTLIENWTRAVREEDINGVLANHTDDIMMFDVPPPLFSKGMDAYRRTWELFFSWSQHLRKFDLSDLEITAADTVAFCHAIGHCAGKEKDGSTSEYNFRLTIGFRKIGGKWMITHEHHSLPSE